MDLIKAIQLRALSNVILDDDDAEYRLRFVFRWYSKAFATPLHQVPDLPLTDVLTAYFEERYESMTDEERETERARLVETNEERKAREAAEAAEASEADAFAREVEAQEARKMEARQKAGVIVDQEKKSGQLVIETMGGGSARVVSEEELATNRSMIAEEAPAISMTFVDDAAFEELVNGHGTMGQPD
jgi:hypothetical protein